MTLMRVDNKDIRTAQVFEILLDNFPDIIHSVDDDGRIVFTNKKAESLLGYTRAELLSMKVRQIYADEVLQSLDAGFDKLKKAGDVTVESVLKAKDGASIPVEIRSFSIYDDAGNFLRTFSILRDVRPIKELQNSLVHAGRLAAIGEMASGVAHDINNPLTVILLATQIGIRELERMGQSHPELDLSGVLTTASDVRRASESIEKLVNHLRNFSRGMKETFERLDLFDVLSDAIFITANKTNACQTTVTSGVRKGVHFTVGSPNQLEQVFVNLISNACDAMEQSKVRKITIEVSSKGGTEAGYWQCDVSDTGSGIPANMLDDIFQAFYTTKAKGKGTGLGLSISRGIVKEHGGDITVASKVGKGTTFSVVLPADNAGQSTVADKTKEG